MWFLSIFNTTSLSEHLSIKQKTIMYSDQLLTSLVDKSSHISSPEINVLFVSKEEMDLFIAEILKNRLRKAMAVPCHCEGKPISLDECFHLIDKRENISFRTVHDPEKIIIR